MQQFRDFLMKRLSCSCGLLRAWRTMRGHSRRKGQWMLGGHAKNTPQVRYRSLIPKVYPVLPPLPRHDYQTPRKDCLRIIFTSSPKPGNRANWAGEM